MNIYLGSDRPGAALLPKQVHHVSGELVAGILVLVELLVVDLPDLGELGAVVRVLDRVICLSTIALSCSQRGEKTNDMQPLSQHTLLVLPHDLCTLLNQQKC
jgi:hypothetical protein